MIDKKQEVTDFIVRYILENEVVTKVNLNDKISDLGMDSLDFTEMVIEVEDRFGINLSVYWRSRNLASPLVLTLSIQQVIDTYFTNKNNSGTWHERKYC